MEHRDVFILESILDYCERIDGAIKDIDSLEKFSANQQAQDLCSFYCLQIGENVHSLSQVFRDNHNKIPWHQISGFRNIIAHEYGNVDIETLWKTVKDSIPELRTFCQEIIK